jgi:hypothetical protein
MTLLAAVAAMVVVPVSMTQAAEETSLGKLRCVKLVVEDPGTEGENARLSAERLRASLLVRLKSGFLALTYSPRHVATIFI